MRPPRELVLAGVAETYKALKKVEMFDVLYLGSAACAPKENLAFDPDGLSRAVEFCKDSDIQAFIRLPERFEHQNEKMVHGLIEFALARRCQGIEINDIGQFELLTDDCKCLELVCGPHINVFNTQGVQVLETLGCDVFVPPMETSREEYCEYAACSRALAIEPFIFGQVEVGLKTACNAATHRNECQAVTCPCVNLNNQTLDVSLCMEGDRLRTIEPLGLLKELPALKQMGINRFRIFVDPGLPISYHKLCRYIRDRFLDKTSQTEDELLSYVNRSLGKLPSNGFFHATSGNLRCY